MNWKPEIESSSSTTPANLVNPEIGVTNIGVTR